MHYLTRRSHRMQKHRFCVTRPSALLMDTAPCPPEHEKYCVDISHPGRTRMQYVTRRSLRMQNTQVRRNVSQHAFCQICTIPSRVLRIVQSHFAAQMNRNALRFLHIPREEKHKFSITCPDTHFVESIPVSPSALYKNHTGPT
jgi:hypothetical protein